MVMEVLHVPRAEDDLEVFPQGANTAGDVLRICLARRGWPAPARQVVADVALAKAAGELAEVPKTQTIADGLQARLGDRTWPIVRDKSATRSTPRSR